MKKIVIICGLISGAIITTMMGIMVSMCVKDPNFEASEVMGYTTMLLAFSLIFVGVKMYRDKNKEKTVNFGKAFLIGLYISLIASTIYVGVWALEYKFVFPGFMDSYSAHTISKAEKSGVSQEKLDKQIASMDEMKKMYKNPLFFTLITYAEILPVGISVSLLTALYFLIYDSVNKRKNAGQLSGS
jgi:hypothetical protein